MTDKLTNRDVAELERVAHWLHDAMMTVEFQVGNFFSEHHPQYLRVLWKDWPGPPNEIVTFLGNAPDNILALLSAFRRQREEADVYGNAFSALRETCSTAVFNIENNAPGVYTADDVHTKLKYALTEDGRVLAARALATGDTE